VGIGAEADQILPRLRRSVAETAAGDAQRGGLAVVGTASEDLWLSCPETRPQ